MLDPDPFKRPDINTILATDKIRKILARRKMMRPFIRIVSVPRQLHYKKYLPNISNEHFAEKGNEKCMELNVYIPDIHL